MIQAGLLFFEALARLEFERYFGPIIRAVPPARSSDVPLDPRSREICLRAAAAVNRASRFVPWAVCLSRARVLDRMLAARHIPVTVRIGVAYPGGKFQAHAWVEHNGKVILGGPVDQYTLLADVNFRASEVVQASACAELKLRQPNQ